MSVYLPAVVAREPDLERVRALAAKLQPVRRVVLLPAGEGCSDSLHPSPNPVVLCELRGEKVLGLSAVMFDAARAHPGQVVAAEHWGGWRWVRWLEVRA